MSVNDIRHCKNEVAIIQNLIDEQNLVTAFLYETDLCLILAIREHRK